MGGDRGQTVFAPLLRRQRRPVAIPVEFEPQDRCPEDAAFPKVVAYPRLYCSQIFANYYCACPMGLERENADHGLVVVAYVSALRGSHACGNPPQSEESDHMINAQAAGMPQDRRHGVSEGRVRGSGEAIRPPWWLIPVLALLV